MQMPSAHMPKTKHLSVNLVTAREAEIALGLSNRSLQRLRKHGILKIGECWIRKFPANANSDVLYDLPACQHALSAATIAAHVEQDRLCQRGVELA